MQVAEIESLREVGIDYITLTSKDRTSDSGLVAFGRHLVQEQAKLAFKVRNYGAQGYRGLIAGSAAFGRRGDGALVRLSGSVASEHWSQCLSLAENCTRIDPQVTVHQAVGCAARLKQHYSQIRRRKTKNGRPSKYKLFVGENGCEALYVNRRVSSQFMRIYDKFAESKLAAYAGCLRYEIEIKGPSALSFASQLEHAADWPYEVARYVNGFLDKKSMSAAVRLGSRLNACVVVNNVPRSLKNASDHLRVCAWIENSVRPSVGRLMECGYQQEVLVALGLVQPVAVNRTIPEMDQGDIDEGV